MALFPEEIGGKRIRTVGGSAMVATGQGGATCRDSIVTGLSSANCIEFHSNRKRNTDAIVFRLPVLATAVFPVCSQQRKSHGGIPSERSSLFTTINCFQLANSLFGMRRT